jgi:hypothetical protein
MNEIIRGKITVTFVSGGISQKGNPYLSVSDGVEPKFVSIPESFKITADTFREYERGDEISLEVDVNPFTGRMTLIKLV